MNFVGRGCVIGTALPMKAMAIGDKIRRLLPLRLGEGDDDTMKRLGWLLILLFCTQCALAEAVPADGLYTIGVSSSAKMFKILDCVLRVEDEKLTAVLTMSGSGYGYLYQGTSAEADAAPRENWTPYFENEDGKHCFAIEIPYLDEELPMAAWSIRYEKWYDRTLKFFSNTMSPCAEIAPDGVYSALLLTDADLEGRSCILRSRDGEMQLEVDGLSIKLPSLDLRCEADGGWVKVESASLAPYAIVAEDGCYAAQTQTDSPLLRFTACRLSVKDGEMTALLTAKNNNFDYIYLGSAADANADPENWIGAVPDADGAYTYELRIPSLDNALQLATYSAKRKLWYDRELTIDTQSLTSVE